MRLQYEIADDQFQVMVAAFCASYGYQAQINGQPNPESQAQFTLRKVREYTEDITCQFLRREATARMEAELQPQLEAVRVNLSVVEEP